MGQLEDVSLWRKYKEAAWPTEFSPDDEENLWPDVAETIHNIMRIVRCINAKELGYISCPITSGKLYYDLLRENNGFFPSQVRTAAMARNFELHNAHFKKWRESIDIPLLFPASFKPAWQRWEQEDFQALWLTIIAEKATRLYMSEGWQYSTGASEEFTHAYQLRLGMPRSGTHFFYNTLESSVKELERMRSIAVLDHEGNELSLEKGLGLIDDAVEYITGLPGPEYGRPVNGPFYPARLIECRDVLARTGEMIDAGFYQSGALER